LQHHSSAGSDWNWNADKQLILLAASVETFEIERIARRTFAVRTEATRNEFVSRYYWAVLIGVAPDQYDRGDW
jgi:hypothetical protein